MSIFPKLKRVKILTFLNYSYFAKIVTRKPKIGNLTNMTDSIHFWSPKSCICNLKGCCGHLTSWWKPSILYIQVLIDLLNICGDKEHLTGSMPNNFCSSQRLSCQILTFKIWRRNFGDIELYKMASWNFDELSKQAVAVAVVVRQFV